MAGPEKHERPWGYFQVLYEDEYCKVKRLVVYPGQRTSLQRHWHRTENWVVVQGTIQPEIDEHGNRVFPWIPPYTWHRIANVGKDDLVIVEVQTGSYFGEDDIERKEDDYDRC